MNRSRHAAGYPPIHATTSCHDHEADSQLPLGRSLVRDEALSVHTLSHLVVIMIYGARSFPCRPTLCGRWDSGQLQMCYSNTTFHMVVR